MTAPDQPAAITVSGDKATAPDHEPICGPSCTPDCGMGHCYLADGPYPDPEDDHKPNEQAGEHALRDRLRDALHSGRAAIHDLPSCTEQADAAMAVVQPVLDAKDAEIRKWQLAYNGANAMARVGKVHLKRLWETRDQLKSAEQRADQAEEIARIARDTSNRSEAERARAVKRAEDAEREATRLTAELAQARADLGRYDHYAVQIGAKELDTQ